MTKRTSRAKAARTRSTTRDLQPKKTVKGGYTPSFRGGVFVAAGDVNNDGKAEVITS